MYSPSSSKPRGSWEIRADTHWFDWRLSELWNFRHLLLRLTRRDFLIHHQQTLLGPLWIILHPLVVLLMYVLIFEKAVGLSTDQLPPSLFYLSGIILWSLFADCFTGTAFTFIQNGTLFGKVYFPRLIMPLSTILVNLARFGIQFILFFSLVLIIAPSRIFSHPFQWITALLFSAAIASGFGLGMGLIFSILTAKYRDLVNVIHLIVRLLMFAAPVIYPMSAINENARSLVSFNPLSVAIETFRYGFLGRGTFTPFDLIFGIIATGILLLTGTIVFNKFGNKLQDVL